MTLQYASDMPGDVELSPDMEMNWPNFFVVGAHKAGTTSLYTHLKRHPQVFLPTVKEPRYFTPEVKYSVSLERYRALYAEARGYKAIGEVTPFYLPREGAAARIREVCPQARIIIILRDPVERAFSHYLYLQRSGPESARSFREAVRRYENKSAKDWDLSQEYVEHGLYYAQVRRYLDVFGSEQVLVLLFDDLTRNPNKLLARIAQHIGVDPVFFESLDVTEASNSYQVPKSPIVRWFQIRGITRRLPRSLVLAMRPLFFDLTKPALDDEARRQLQDLYGPDLARLEELLGRKLPELKKSWI